MVNITPSLLSSNQQRIAQVVQQHQTPLYFYDFGKIEDKFDDLTRILPGNFQVHYTLKANSNLAICHHLAQLGAAADISSIGELVAAIKAGFSPQQIVFTGPGKTNRELSFALKQNIGLIVVESVTEARRLNSLAAESGIKQNILVRINPTYRTDNSCEISQGNSNNNCVINSDTPIQLISQNASKFGIDEQVISLDHTQVYNHRRFFNGQTLEYVAILARKQS